MGFWFPVGLHALQSAIVVGVLGFTSADSLARPTLLPVIAALGIRSLPVNRDDLSTKLAAGCISMNGVGMLCQYLDFAIVSKWSCSAGGPTSTRGGIVNADARPVPRSKSVEGESAAGVEEKECSWWQKLKWGLFTSTAWRLTATPWQVTGVPAFRADDSRRGRAKFIAAKLFNVIASLLWVDSLSLLPQDPAMAEMFAASKVPFFSRWVDLTTQDVVARFLTTAIGWTSIACTLQGLYSLFAIIGVASGLAPIKEWPPMFGSLSDCHSIRSFWGRFWHQIHRRRISSPSYFITHGVLGLKRGGIVARYVNVFLTFAVSGLLHVAEEYGTGVTLAQSGSMRFFCTQALGLMFEDAVTALVHACFGRKKRRWTRVVGYVWFVCWMAWTSPSWLYPKLRNNQGGEKDRMLPFSIMIPAQRFLNH